MSKRAPRLQFTDEELAAPEVSKAAKKRKSISRSWSRQKRKSQQRTAQRSRAQHPSCNTPFGMYPVRRSVRRRTGRFHSMRMITSA